MTKKTKIIRRGVGVHDLKLTVFKPQEVGEGHYTEEIAQMLGVMNKKRDKYSKKLIDAIVKFYDKELPSSGGKITWTTRESNGGNGTSQYIKPKYDGMSIAKIRKYITKKCSDTLKNSTNFPPYFTLCKVNFTLENPEHWDIFDDGEDVLEEDFNIFED